MDSVRRAGTFIWKNLIFLIALAVPVLAGCPIVIP